MDKDIIVGIDLGTTNSVVSVLDNHVPKTISIDNAKLLPSVVSLTDKGFIVGQAAKNMAILEPENTIASVKRKMGQGIELQIGNKKMKPEEVSAVILRKIKDTVDREFNLDGKALRAVVTVPAYFTEEQREATKQSAELANLKVERIINEPTAAGLAFGLSNMHEAVYAIYDLGGGTFDVSIIESNEGLVEVLATTGNNMLGGDDFDKSLAAFIWEKFTGENNLKNYKPSDKENARLLRIAEKTKIELSSAETVQIQENFFLKVNDKAFHLETTVSREELEALIQGSITETVELLENAIDDANLDVDELDGIILVGGSSRIPLVSRLIEERTGVAPSLIDLPDEAVSHGATIQGAIIDHEDIDTVLVDITPHSLGIAVLDPSEEMNFMSFLSENGPELGTSVLIPKNTPVPVKKTERYNAVTPFQEGYEIKVCQGEHEHFADNKMIGETYLKVENPIEHGSIEVSFQLDINGILEVTAVETTTGEKVKAEFKSSRGKKIKKSKSEEALISLDEASLNLVNRAEKLLVKEKLNKDDEEELNVLLKKFKAQRASGEDEAASQTETELLDLLYYLETDENKY